MFAALTSFLGENISSTWVFASVSPDCSAPVVISCSLCEQSAGTTCTQYMGQTFTGCIQLGKASESVQICKQANTILAFQPSPSVQRLVALLKISPGCSEVGLFYNLQRPVFGRCTSERPCICLVIVENVPPSTMCFCHIFIWTSPSNILSIFEVAPASWILMWLLI